MLAQRHRRWANIEPTLGNNAISVWYTNCQHDMIPYIADPQQVSIQSLIQKPSTSPEHHTQG